MEPLLPSRITGKKLINVTLSIKETKGETVLDTLEGEKRGDEKEGWLKKGET